MKVVADHGWPKASLGEEGDENAFDAFKNERDYIAQGKHMQTTVAAMDWAAREIDRLRLDLHRAQENHKCIVATKRITDERLRIALAGLQKVYDDSCEDNITLIASEAFEEATHENPRLDSTRG